MGSALPVELRTVSTDRLIQEIINRSSRCVVVRERYFPEGNEPMISTHANDGTGNAIIDLASLQELLSIAQGTIVSAHIQQRAVLTVPQLMAPTAPALKVAAND